MRKQQAAHSQDGLHYFVLHAHAKRGRKGAYVSCWINFRLYEGALALAKFYVRDAGWKVRSIDQHRWINGLPDVPIGSKTYFREAKKDGASFVVHTYDKRRASPAKR